MGKNLIQQARGKGGPRYRAPSFRSKGKSEYARFEKGTISGEIVEFIHCQAHSAPLVQIEYENGSKVLLQAPEGVRIGEMVEMGEKVKIKNGNIMPLKNIPEGVSIYNIESFSDFPTWRCIS